MGRDPNLDPERDELRARIQTEALFVRGLGYGDEIEGLATELYSPHDAWCVANVGLTVGDAYRVLGILGEMVSGRLGDVRARAHELEAEFEHDPESALRHADEFPVLVREALVSGAIEAEPAQLAKSLA